MRRWKHDVENKEFTNNDGSKFIVLKTDIKNNRNQTQWLCKFETGYETFAQTQDIINGRVKDYLYPTVLNVGALGYDIGKRRIDLRIYWIWLYMLRRCYDKNHWAYKYYEKVYVCDRWKRFDLFYEDYKNIEGFDEELFESGELILDKDIKNIKDADGNKYYSTETCKWITQRENLLPNINEINRKRRVTTNCT